VDAPGQMVDTDALTFMAGAALTTMVIALTAEQPAALDPVTLYVVVTDGLTVILADVAPLLHTKLDPPDAVKMVDAPGQMVSTDALTLMTGAAPTTMVILSIAEHPAAFVPVTLYVVVTDGLTVMLVEVAPLLQT
jgi:hypothetical protein